MIDKQARSESLDYLRGSAGPCEIEYSDLPEPNTPQARHIADQLKPVQYARLAVAADFLLNYTFSQIESRPPTGLLDNGFANNSPFLNLRDNVIYTFRRDIYECATSDEFLQAESVVKLVGRLDNNRFSDLKEQLQAGVHTAANTMLKFLSEIPDYMKQQQIDANLNTVASTARNSVKVPTELAMLCVNQFLGVHYIMDEQRENGIETPTIVSKKRHDGSHSLQFNDLGSLVLKAGSKLHPAIPVSTADQRIADINCHQERTIGCPVTLLPGKIHRLWNWFIDIAESENLWNLPVNP